MEWISLEGEKVVPKKGQICIVIDGESLIRIREWGTHYFHSIDPDSDDGMQSINISHWMPLPPNPPKEKLWN